MKLLMRNIIHKFNNKMQIKTKTTHQTLNQIQMIKFKAKMMIKN